MIMIYSADKNWGIGKQGQLLAKLPKDLAFFKEKTLNKVVIMGRKTYESLPKKAPLKNRINIVLTKKTDLELDGFKIAHNIKELKELIKDIPSDDVYIIGGESLYRYFKEYSKFAYVTKIKEQFDADTFAPDLDKDMNWRVEEISELVFDNGHKTQVFKYINDNVKELL